MSGQQEFAAQLRQVVREAERRLNRGIDRSRLARKLHVSPQSLYAYLSGATVPSAATLTALLAELVASDRIRELLARERDRLIESRRKPRQSKPDEPPAAIPRQLPPAVSGFVGRQEELAVLTRLQTAGDALAVICGTAGVGKTALAVQWAHQTAEPFPDGSLFLDLRGHDPDRPVAVAEALGAFLRALGVSGAGLPPGETERAALYRTMLASRNMLIILDNAATVAQVRPLLPGTGANMVVVTSRNRLSGLVARDGAKRLVVDLLSVPEAAGLIQRLTENRSISRPQAEELARRCARLPLALRVAAELVLAHPGAPVDELISGLGDAGRRRLDLLAALGDDRTDARSVFSWSYRHLPETAARAFRFMGLPQGGAVDAYACAALLGSDLAEAVSAIDQLAQAHLVTPTAGGAANGLAGMQVTMHDLLRAYAAELAYAIDPALEREAALRRLLDHYRFCASLAVPQVSPADAARMPQLVAPESPLPQLADRHTAHSWLDLHGAILLHLTRQAEQRDLSRHAADLAVILTRYFIVRADYPQAVLLCEHGLRAARRLEDTTSETTLLLDLGTVHARWCRYDEAISYLERGLEMARAHGHRLLQTRALGGLGSLHWSIKGDYGQAAEYLEQALLLAREAADEVLEGKVCGELGVVYQKTGRYQEALPHMRLALELQRRHGEGVTDPVVMANLGFALVEIGQERDGIPYLAKASSRLREAGNLVAEGSAQLNLGIAHLRLGEIGQARRYLLRGLRVNRQAGHRVQEAHGLDQLGRLLSREGKHDKALAHHQRALAIYSGLGNRSMEAFARTDFGLSLIAAGRVEDALGQLGKALAWSSGTQAPMQEAAAHDGLGQAYLAAGDGDRACRHWLQALDIYVRLELPAAAEVRRRLDSLGQRAA